VPSSWRSFGRVVEITTVVLLVLAVGYLLTKSDPEDIEVRQDPNQPQDTTTETAEQPSQPQMTPAAESVALQQPAERSRSTEASPPTDLYQPQPDAAADYGTASTTGPCRISYQILSTVQAKEMTPLEIVEQVNSGIQTRLRNTQDGYMGDPNGLYDLFNTYLLPYVDTTFAAGALLGKHWRTATENQKDRFTCALVSGLVRKHATELMEYYLAEHSILPFDTPSSERRTTRVRTTWHLPDGTGIPVEFNFVRRQDQWRIFDVTIEGVSSVKNYRAEFDAEIRASSIEALITRLERDAQNATFEDAE
jgi:phospholipid transport system substrate-binding protein